LINGGVWGVDQSRFIEIQASSQIRDRGTVGNSGNVAVKDRRFRNNLPFYSDLIKSGKQNFVELFKECVS
jgi:hypothetical protein